MISIILQDKNNVSIILRFSGNIPTVKNADDDNVRCEEGFRVKNKRSGGIIKVILFIKSCNQISNFSIKKLAKVIMVVCCTNPVLHITCIVIGVASG